MFLALAVHSTRFRGLVLSGFKGKQGFKLTLTVLAIYILAVNSQELGIGAQTNLPDFNFGAAGDWGCNSESKSTLDNILSKQPELVLGLGDYSYEESADCWLEIIDPIDEKIRIAIGNHDVEFVDQLMRHFNLTMEFYSFTYQNVHFIVMSTVHGPRSELSYRAGSEQYEFIKQELEESSKDPDINWIIVYFHQPAYTSPARNKALLDLRDIYHPLFDKYGVDLVLQAHIHNYQRSYPIQYNNSTAPSNPTITDINTSRYNDPKGVIFLTVGTGGKSLDSLTGQAYYNYYQQSTEFGFLNLNVSNNGTTLTGIFYDNSGAILDEFSIDKK